MKGYVPWIGQYRTPGEKKNIEIHGAQSTENEDLQENVKGMVGKLSFPFPSAQDIKAVHRLPTGTANTPPIFVRFAEGNVRRSGCQEGSAQRC